MILTWSDLILIIDKAFDLKSAHIAELLDVRRGTISELKRGKIRKSTLTLEEWYSKLFAPANCPVKGDDKYLLSILKIGVDAAGFREVMRDLWKEDNEYKDGDYETFVMTMLNRTRSNEPPMGNEDDILPSDKDFKAGSDTEPCATDDKGVDNKSGLRELIEHRRSGDYRIDAGVSEMIKQFKIIFNRYRIVDLIGDSTISPGSYIPDSEDLSVDEEPPFDGEASIDASFFYDVPDDPQTKKDWSATVGKFIKTIDDKVIGSFGRNHNERRLSDKITEFCKDLEDYVGLLGLDSAFGVSSYFGFREGIDDRRESLIRLCLEICNNDNGEQ